MTSHGHSVSVFCCSGSKMDGLAQDQKVAPIFGASSALGSGGGFGGFAGTAVEPSRPVVSVCLLAAVLPVRVIGNLRIRTSCSQMQKWRCAALVGLLR
jgi:hypothetical protein